MGHFPSHNTAFLLLHLLYVPYFCSYKRQAVTADTQFQKKDTAGSQPTVGLIQGQLGICRSLAGHARPAHIPATTPPAFSPEQIKLQALPAAALWIKRARLPYVQAHTTHCATTAALRAPCNTKN